MNGTTTATARSQAPKPVVSVKKLRQNYGKQEAVCGIDFDIFPKEIFGLIGPDGAGKTSIFHILGGVMPFSGGEVTVLDTGPRQARFETGYLTQQFSLYEDLSVRENLNYIAALRQVPREDFQERSRKYLALMDLSRFSDRLAGKLSGGMKQKLALCCALISRPKLLLLDEPTTGVDPVSRRDFWDILSGIVQEGVTVAVATPYLDEAERCSRLALIYDGSIQQMGSPQELKQSLKLSRIEVRSDSLDEIVRAVSSEAFMHASSITDIHTYGDRIDVLATDGARAQSSIQNLAEKKAIKLKTALQEPTLENVFIKRLEDKTRQASTNLFSFSRSRRAKADKEQAILADNLSKAFGEFWAAKDVSLAIGKGEIFGLLGANGAGKTTTIKMLCGLLPPTSGSMQLLGQTGDLDRSELRQRLGYMSQKFTLYNDLTVKENLDFYCGVYGVPVHLRKDRINWVLGSCGLENQGDLLTARLPGGWKQRLAFGACIMHEPEVLFLDEPTSGVDAVARRQLWSLIRELAKNGTAVLVTTHFLEEAEQCQNLAFMAGGRVVAQGSPDQIKSSQPGRLFEIRTSDLQGSSDLLKRTLQRWQVSIFADKLHVVVKDPAELLKIEVMLKEAGFEIVASREIPFSLEDSFIGIVDRAQEGGV